MRRQRRSSKVNPPDLFSPPPVIPTWSAVTPEIQQQLRSLLAKMLQAGYRRPGLQTPPKGVSNE
jgi:hypothetical protein